MWTGEFQRDGNIWVLVWCPERVRFGLPGPTGVQVATVTVAIYVDGAHKPQRGLIKSAAIFSQF